MLKAPPVPDYKALLADAQARAEKLRVELAATEREIMLLEELVLHDSNSTNIVPNMQPRTSEKPARRGRPLETKHPFPRKLTQLKPPMTVTAWAERHGYDRARVKSWYAEGDGGRSIPRDIAESIEKELGIPATRSTWKNGIA